MKSYNKFLTATIVLTTIVGSTQPAWAASSTTSASVAAQSIQDLHTAADWAQAAILEAQQLHIMKGDVDGNFRPLDTLTREELAVVLTSLLDLKVQPTERTAFADVKPADWSAPYIEAVRTAGIMLGDGNGSFRPTSPITREELAATLVKAAKVDPQGKGSQLSVADKQEISQWAQDYVQTAIELGLMRGDGSRFLPQQLAERQQVATVAVNFRKITASAAPTIQTLTADSVTIQGVTYSLADSVKALLRPANAQVLQGAKIKFTAADHVLSQVTELEIRNGGQAPAANAPEFSGNLVLDGANGVLNGNLKIKANYITVQNLQVSGDFEIGAELANDFYAKNLKVGHRTRIGGGDTNTIVFEDASLQTVDVEKSNVHVESKGKTQLAELIVHTDAAITADAAVKIPKVSLVDGAKSVELNASVQALEVTAQSGTTLSGKSSISELTVKANAKLDLHTSGTISKVTLEDKTSKLAVQAGAKIDKIVIPAGSSASDVIENYSQVKASLPTPVYETPAAGGGGGGGGGGGVVVPTPTPNPDPVPQHPHTSVPEAPTVYTIIANDDQISGTAEYGSTITVKKDGVVLASDKVAGHEQYYTLSIPPQPEGTVLAVTATNEIGASSARMVTVVAAQVSLKVLSPDKRPISQATVVMRSATGNLRQLKKTDASGSVSLAGLVKFTDYVIEAYNPANSSWLDAPSYMFTYTGDETSLPDMHALRVDAIGHVQDEQGRAVSDAYANVLDPFGKSMETGPLLEDGSFRVGGLTDGSTYTLQIQGYEYETLEQTFVYHTANTGAQNLGTLSLKTAAHTPAPAEDVSRYIEGFVQNPDGSPVAEAWVTVLDGNQYLYDTQTDARGHYRINSLHEGTSYQMFVSAWNSEFCSPAVTPFTYTANVHTGPTVKLRNPDVVGVVKDARGQLIAGSTVWVAVGNDTLFTTTDAAGRYRFAGLEAGQSYSLHASTPTGSPYVEAAPLSFTKQAGTVKGPDLVLRDVDLYGKIFEPDGVTPATHATIHFYDPAADAYYTSETLDNGVYKFGALNPGTSYRVSVFPESTSPWVGPESFSYTYQKTDRRVADIQLRAAELIGTVLTPDGKPVNAQLTVQNTDTNEIFSVWSNSFGRYKFAGLKKGETYKVTASPFEASSNYTESNPVTFTYNGEQLNLKPIQLSIPTITGNVYLPNHQDAAHEGYVKFEKVQDLTDPAPTASKSASIYNGNYRVKLEDGTYRVTAHSDTMTGADSDPVLVTIANGKPLQPFGDLVLATPFLYGVIQDSAGTRMEWATLDLFDDQHQIVQQLETHYGEFAFRKLAPGTYTLYAQSIELGNPYAVYKEILTIAADTPAARHDLVLTIAR